jgi:microcystin-dependent protein
LEISKFETYQSDRFDFQENIMTCSFKKAAFLCGLATAAWSPASHACTSDPIMSSICVMTVSPAGRFDTFNNGTYVLASGQTLAINSNTALFSLIGITFGGNGSTTFNLPDLRGKVIVGYDARDGTRAVGAAAGNTTVNLSVAQLPPHTAILSNVPVSLSGVTATTTLSGLTATANLGGMVIAGPATGLTMRVLSGSNGQNTPANNYLGKPLSSSTNIYAAGTPNATLNAGAIGGTLSMTVNANTNAPVTGAATTTLSGTGQANGASAIIGSGVGVPIMPPYLVLPYYIAVQGIYPSSD